MTKKNIILALVLILLIGGAYIYQGPFRNWQTKNKKTDNFLEKVNIDDVTKIEISRAGQTTILKKDGNNWKIENANNFKANSAMVTSLLDKLKEAGKGNLDLASENKDKKQDFETGDNGTKIKLLKDDNEMISLIVGKVSPDYLGNYISTENSDKTYLIKANVASIISTDEWYDKTIFSDDKSKIIKLRFQYPNSQFTIENKDGKWTSISPKGVNVKEEKISEILDIMSNLSAASIPEQKFEGTGLEKSSIIIQAQGDNIDSTIMVGNKDKEGNYYAKRGDSDNIYVITKEQRDMLNKKLNDLK